MDITEIGLQPSVDNEPFWCFFYILFIVCSNFYLLNLFVGTVYEKYILIRDSGVEDLTKPQRHWVLIMEHIRDISPHKGNRHPNYKLSLLKRVGKFSRSGAEEFVESRLFEEILIGTIIFNCIVMALTYHGESESWSFMLTVCNQCCLLVFTAEVFFKVRASSVQTLLTIRTPRNCFWAPTNILYTYSLWEYFLGVPINVVGVRIAGA